MFPIQGRERLEGRVGSVLMCHDSSRLFMEQCIGLIFNGQNLMAANGQTYSDTSVDTFTYITSSATPTINNTTFTLSGSIDPAASVIVPGSGTAFLSEVSIGDEIVVSEETRIVTSIASDTSLTVSVAFSNNSNDATPDCNPVAPIDVILS